MAAIAATLALTMCGCSTTYKVTVRAQEGANDSTDVDVLLFWPLSERGRTVADEASGYFAIQKALRETTGLEKWEDWEAADLGTLSVADDRDCLVLEDIRGNVLSQSGDTPQLIVFTSYAGFQKQTVDLRSAENPFDGFLGMFRTAYLHIFLEKDEFRAEFVPSGEFLGNLLPTTSLCHPERQTP